MSRLLPLLLVLGLCPGCFVFDELDKGQAILEQHTPRDRKAQAPAPDARPRPAGREEPGVVAGLVQDAKDWWARWRAPEPTGPDPDDIVVRCEFGGRSQFMRRSDCDLRGGRSV